MRKVVWLALALGVAGVWFYVRQDRPLQKSDGTQNSQMSAEAPAPSGETAVAPKQNPPSASQSSADPAEAAKGAAVQATSDTSDEGEDFLPAASQNSGPTSAPESKAEPSASPSAEAVKGHAVTLSQPLRTRGRRQACQSGSPWTYTGRFADDYKIQLGTDADNPFANEFSIESTRKPVRSSLSVSFCAQLGDQDVGRRLRVSAQFLPEGAFQRLSVFAVLLNAAQRSVDRGQEVLSATGSWIEPAFELQLYPEAQQMVLSFTLRGEGKLRVRNVRVLPIN